jgi:hypothetical protein
MPDLADGLPAAVPDRLTVIYSAGRTGTRTLLETLKSAHPDEWVADVRRLRADLGEYHGWIQSHRVAGRRPVRTHDPAVAELIRARADLPVRMIVPIRDPVSAAVSSYFWNFPLRHGPSTPLPALEAIATDVAGGAFATRPDYYTGWLDFELAAFTGLDPYAVPVDRDAGYVRLERDRFTVILLRTEDLDVVAPAALAGLGLDVCDLQARQHDGTRQPYGSVYAAFRDRPRLPADWVDAQLATRFAAHFYDAAERAEIAARWSRASEPD